MTLTEQWKKGELEAGWYYVLLFSNEEYITFIDGNWVVDDRLIGADIEEVIAPVPSYEEWQHQQMSLRMTIDDYKNVVDICEQLKELLKECGQKFFEAEGNYGFDDSIVDICSPMIDKITNAIGDI